MTSKFQFWKKHFKLFLIENKYFKYHLLKKPCAYLSFFCIHVFNFRSSLRKSLFKRSSIQFLTRERQLVIARTERRIGYVSVRLTNRRKRARGSFFLWRENPPRHFAQVFWWDTWSFARSFSVIFPWKIVFSFSRSAYSSWEKLKLSYILYIFLTFIY